MKIAILTSGILPVPAVQGGAVENLIDSYLEYNDQFKLHDITIYSVAHPKTKWHPAINSSSNHYIFINVYGVVAKTKRFLFKLFKNDFCYNYFIDYYFEQSLKILKKNNYDCIVLENRPDFAYKLSQKGYKNIILHLHNDMLNEYTQHHTTIFNSLSKILTVSDYIKKRVSTIQDDPKIITIHNGIDLKLFKKETNSPITREKLGFSCTDFVLVFTGRINPDKGINELIDAMILLKDIPHIKLLVIGSTFFANIDEDNDYIITLKNKAKVIENNIVFTGYIAYSEMPKYLQLANVAVIPSVWDDPFPTTVLEAQAMGLPIIASNRGGIPEEVCEENSILLDTNSHYITSLANAIKRISQSKALQESMSKASILQSKTFSKERFAKDIFNSLSQS